MYDKLERRMIFQFLFIFQIGILLAIEISFPIFWRRKIKKIPSLENKKMEINDFHKIYDQILSRKRMTPDSKYLSA